MDALTMALRAAGLSLSTAQRFRGGGTETIWMLPTTGTNAISLWRRLHDVVGTTGLYPVILGTNQDLELFRENEEEFSAQEDIRQGLHLDAAVLLIGWKADPEEDDPDYDPEFYRGDWPVGDHANREFAITLEKEPLWLGLFPTRVGWELPAHLPFGGWNACPFPAEHVCMMKRWHDLYGAEVVCITHDVVEMAVARPPRSHDDAMTLALEQFTYCEDIVSQGTETVEGLAATLLNGTSWFFWWD